MKTATFKFGKCTIGIATKIPTGKPDRAIALGDLGREKYIFFYRGKLPEIDMRTNMIYRTEILKFTNRNSPKPQHYLTKEKFVEDTFLILLIQRVNKVEYNERNIATYVEHESTSRRSYLVGMANKRSIIVTTTENEERVQYVIKNEIELGGEICVIECPPDSTNPNAKKVFVITDKK